jgi:hypothetical protein
MNETTMPQRIQRKRTRGWKMPPNTVSVARPGRWGNPFIVAGPKYWAVPTAEDAVACFREMMEQSEERQVAAAEELRGKNLACFCRLDQPCHADVLIEIANRR